MEEYPEHIDELIGRVLNGEADATEIAELQEWRLAAPEQEAYFRMMEKIMSVPGEELTPVNVDAAWQKVSSVIDEGKKEAVIRKMNMNWWQIAAAAVVVVMIGIYWFNVRPVNEKHFTASAELLNTSLPDGSEIFIKEGSSIDYKEQYGKREVELQGEAYFKVKHDSAHPFIVSVMEISVTDIGTAFNIRSVSDSDLVEVAVEEGEVEIQGDNFNIRIKAGNGAVYQRGKAVKTFELKNRNISSYATGVLEFVNAPLSEVAATLEKTFGVSVKVDDAVSNCALTADFSNEKLDTLLEILAATLHLEVVRNGNSIELKGNGCL